MEMKLVDGDYVSDGMGGFEMVSAEEEVLQRVLFKLQARKGGFAPMPDLGSNLYKLTHIRNSEREIAAKQFIAEALIDEPVELDNMEMIDTDDGVSLKLWFEYNGESYETPEIVIE